MCAGSNDIHEKKVKSLFIFCPLRIEGWWSDIRGHVPYKTDFFFNALPNRRCNFCFGGGGYRGRGDGKREKNWKGGYCIVLYGCYCIVPYDCYCRVRYDCYCRVLYGCYCIVPYDCYCRVLYMVVIV